MEQNWKLAAYMFLMGFVPVKKLDIRQCLRLADRYNQIQYLPKRHDEMQTHTINFSVVLIGVVFGVVKVLFSTATLQNRRNPTKSGQTGGNAK